MNNPSGDNADLPLRGIRVVEFGQYIAVPAAAQILSDLGADVIKVESPAGDAARQVGWTGDAAGPMFTAYNRGKRSVVLDLRAPRDRDSAVQLARGADVVLQNLRPGAMERQGLGADILMRLSPRLIYGQVSAFGQQGVGRNRPGFDIAAQAESGMMSLNGESGRDPVRVGFTVVDIMAAQTLATGVLAALVRRGMSGRGGWVDISLIDVAVASLCNTWAEYRLNGAMPLRRGNGQLTMAPAADVVNTQDGQIVLSAYTEEHFAKLCQVIGRPELAVDPRFSTNKARVSNRPALMQTLESSLRAMTSEALVALLSEGGVVAGSIRNLSQVQPGQGGVAHDLFVQVQCSGREPVSLPGLPLQLDGFKRQDGRLPALGEHTAEVLAELSRHGQV